jgi:hypothetical protein
LRNCRKWHRGAQKSGRIARQGERFFTAEQVKQIINASEEPYSILWAVLGLTGCRAGEVFALRRSDLDFEKRVIRIRRTLDAATRQTHVPESRSSSADLTIPDPLQKRLRTLLAQHWRENETETLRGEPINWRTTSGSLSSRKATNLECLRQSASVHSRNSISATSLDSTGPIESSITPERKVAGNVDELRLVTRGKAK